jgi:hypothetical protein
MPLASRSVFRLACLRRASLARLLQRSAVTAALGAVFACSENVRVGYDLPVGGTASGSGGASGGATMSGGQSSGGRGGGAGAPEPGPCEVRLCQNKSYECGNCIDDDGDGQIDALDPDCLGACDNSEDSYFGNIPGQNNTACRQDCYFDQDSGSGNDGCDWTHSCDPLSLPPNYPPSGDARCAYDAATMLQSQSCEGLSAAPPQACLDYCLPLTPNGCDCFGCCELPARSNRFVWIGSTRDGAGSCDAASVDDPTACRPCNPVKSCFNVCAPCETCVGTVAPDPSCTGGGTCSVGIGPCAAGATCPADAYCVTGCCIGVPR